MTQMEGNPEAPETTSPMSKPAADAAPGLIRPLRIWPAVMFVVLIWAARVVPGYFEDAGFYAFLSMVLGPLVCALGILGWWSFFSRATVWEKLTGVAGLVVLTVATNALSHESMAGFGVALYCIPWAFTVFAGAAVLLANKRPVVRTGCSLALTAIPFIALLPYRNDGIWGDMKADMSFRWGPSKTDQILEKLKSRGGLKAASEEGTWAAPEVAEWGEFRGPQRDSKVYGIKLVADWAAKPPKEIWRRPVGPGWGSFCVVGDRLFTQEQRGEQELVSAFESATGSQIWIHTDEAHFYEPIGGSGPRGTPTYEMGRLYTMGAKGAVDCLDAGTGELIWTRDLKADSGAQPPTWGFSSSPLVVGDLVVVHAGGTNAQEVDVETKIAPKGLVAYDKKTGEVRWTAPAGEHSYSSPHLLPGRGESGTPLILMLTNSGLGAHDPATGKVVWENRWVFEGYRVVQPLVINGESFLMGTTMGVGTRRIDLKGDKLSEAWTSTAMKPYYNDFVEHQGYLYGFDHDLFSCVDLSNGKRKWKKGRYGNGQVLLLADADQLLVQAESGEVVLLAADPQQHHELGRFPALTAKTWNHPVLVKDRLYVRNGEEAACFELAWETAGEKPTPTHEQEPGE